MSRKSSGRGGAAQRGAAAKKVNPIVRGTALDLGDLSGETQDIVTATFRYFGEVIRVNPDVSEVDLIDFMDDASRVSVNDPASITIVKTFARSMVHREDFDQFWMTVRKNRQDSDAVMGVLWKVLDGVTARPTTPPSDSSDGRPATSPPSPLGVSAPDGSEFPDRPGDREQIRDALDDSLRERFMRQIERFEAAGNVAVAAQIAVAAEARGIDVTRGPVVLDGTTV